MQDTRKCLKCRKDFKPKHEYNFLCKKCNLQNETQRDKTVPTRTNPRVIRKEPGDI